MDCSKKTILVVDDQREILDMLCQLMAESGYRVIGEDNALAVVDDVKREAPDLVSLDMVMPGASGIEVLKAMRREGLDVPVIIISGFMNIDTQEDLIGLGVKGTLTKPVRLQEVRNVLSDILGDA
jgi:DNA-binding NtrC family response regulator